VGYVYRIGILAGFLFGVVLAIAGSLTVERFQGSMLPWVIALIVLGSTLWIGPAFSELYARVFVPHYQERSFATYAGTITFWVGIVLSLLVIVFVESHVKTLVLLNVLGTMILGYLIPVAYEHRLIGGTKPAGQQ
jgi:hypothetical protein